MGNYVIKGKTIYHLTKGELGVFQMFRIIGNWKKDVLDGEITVLDIENKKTHKISYIDGIKAW